MAVICERMTRHWFADCVEINSLHSARPHSAGMKRYGRHEPPFPCLTNCGFVVKRSRWTITPKNTSLRCEPKLRSVARRQPRRTMKDCADGYSSVPTSLTSALMIAQPKLQREPRLGLNEC